MEVTMANSTFNDVIKQYCGLSPTDTSFDTIFSTSLKSSLLKLEQLSDRFSNISSGITLDSNISDLNDVPNIDSIMEYISLNARLAFDPPASSQILQAYKDEISQLEFRFSIM